jgi:SNF2 family DNA or RNA helicase
MDLFDHQKEDALKMANGDDVPNFSEAGTGKTHSTLHGIELAKFQGGLIVAPPIALPMWRNEIEEYLGATATILKSGKSPVRGDSDFYITSYGLASNIELRSKLMEWGNETKDILMVLDESQYLKNRDSARTRAIFGPVTTGRKGLYEHFDQAWQLSGTPILKHADDLWSQLRATQPTVLRDMGVLEFDDFVSKFCVRRMKKYHPRMAPQMVVINSQNEVLLNRMLYKDIGSIRRLMKDVGKDMPPLTYRDVFVKINRSPELASLTKAMGIKDPNDFLDLDTLDDVIMTKARRLLGMLKVDGTVDYALEQKGPLLIGYWYTDVGDAIQKALDNAGLITARVMGGVSPNEKERIRRAFNGGFIDVLVGQLSSMNVSWNLQECGNHVLIHDDDFSPSIIEQFVKRVWRFGQTNHVQVDMIKADHIIDDVVTTVRERKAKTHDKIIG